jgi:hypothetical protein
MRKERAGHVAGICQYTHVNVPRIFSNTTPPNLQQRCATFKTGNNTR